MRRFKITVNNQVYDVCVEEKKESDKENDEESAETDDEKDYKKNKNK